MNEMKHEDARSGCSLCYKCHECECANKPSPDEYDALLCEKDAEIERMRGILAELEEVRLEYLEGKYTEADMVVRLYLIRKKYEEGRKKTNLIDGHLLLKELKEWREQIPPDHQDPVVECETLEGVEHMVRRLMGITEEGKQ